MLAKNVEYFVYIDWRFKVIAFTLGVTFPNNLFNEMTVGVNEVINWWRIIIKLYANIAHLLCDELPKM